MWRVHKYLWRVNVYKRLASFYTSILTSQQLFYLIYLSLYFNGSFFYISNHPDMLADKAWPSQQASTNLELMTWLAYKSLPN